MSKKRQKHELIGSPAEDMTAFINKLIDDSKTPYGETFSDTISDGYHTFGELYEHRTMLFLIICRLFKDYAWKSKLHYDGTMYNGMFIAGIETPNGQATYHIEDKYWDLFDITEVPNAPEWDGHTPDDAIKRILTLVR